MFMFVEYDTEYNHRLYSNYQSINELCKKLEEHHINDNVMYIDFYIGFDCILCYVVKDEGFIYYYNIMSDRNAAEQIIRTLRKKVK